MSFDMLVNVQLLFFVVIMLHKTTITVMQNNNVEVPHIVLYWYYVIHATI